MKIAHIADLQVKNRNKNLEKPYSNNLLEITKKIAADNEIECLIIAGDLFEFPEPNESERSMIYSFLSNIPKIEHLKEIVLIPGNHDLVKFGKSQIETEIGEDLIIKNTPLDLFINIISSLSKEYSEKYIYIDRSGIYQSKHFDNIQYIGYSLEDGMNVDMTGFEEDKLNICVFHGMVRDYVEMMKLPMRKDIVARLKTLDDFPKNSYILAGDIHQRLHFKNSENNVDFYYSGSTQQHTHSEGWYLYLDNPKNNTITDEYKSILTYNVDGTVLSKPENTYLKNFVSYITVTIGSKDWDWSSLKGAIDSILWDNITGIDATYITIKSKNKFSKYERNIYELLKIHVPNSLISFDYGKLSSDIVSIVDNTVVKYILDEKVQTQTSTETETEFNIGDIDHLVLTEDELEKMFTYVINQQILKAETNNSENVRKELVSLFKDQMKNVSKKSRYFSIKIREILCNQFMTLGKNDIKLDNEGITRILGTNGVGKTTLFRMIRWVLTGEVFEGMKSNTSVKNNLGIFNEKLNNDFVSVLITLDNNNVPILIKRTATRKWKNNTTDEDKISKDWSDFISTIETNLSVIINVGNENEKTLTGVNAQTNINAWFGDTINKIMFINQMKIEEILKSDKSDMNDTILDYIGCDYLKGLENNLDEVKSDLMSLQRPKRDRTSIINDLSNAEKNIKNVESLITENTENIETENKELGGDKILLESYEKSLMSLGDIPAMIENKKSDLALVTDKLSLYKPKKPKQHIQLDITKPEKQDTTDIDNGINSLTTYITQLEESLKHVHDNLIKSFDDKISENREMYKTKQLEYNNIVVTFYEKQKEYDEFINRVKTIVLNKINELKTKISINEKSIDELNDEISKGVCSKCGRPFSDNYEEHRESLTQQITSLHLENQSLDEIIKLLQRTYDNEIHTNISLKNREHLEIIKTNRFTKNKFSDLSEIYKLVYEMENITKDIKTIDDDSALIKSNYETFKTNVSESKTTGYEEYDSLKISITDEKKHLEELKKSKTKIDDEYQNLINIYLRKVEEVNEQNAEIDKWNEQVIAEQQSHISDMEKSKHLKNEIDDLNNNLPKYNELFSKHNHVKLETEKRYQFIRHLMNNETEFKVTKSNLESVIGNLKTELENYDKYRENEIIWKIYSKVIKDQFKGIVFEYYRTFLNRTLDTLLTDVYFNLFWDSDNQLILVSIDNGKRIYTPIKQASGMETIFAGLALIYTISLLNIKHVCSHIFIDELSGQLSTGKNIEFENVENYQELFINILHKFTDKSIFIVDHNIDYMRENMCYLVTSTEQGSVYIDKSKIYEN